MTVQLISRDIFNKKINTYRWLLYMDALLLCTYTFNNTLTLQIELWKYFFFKGLQSQHQANCMPSTFSNYQLTKSSHVSVVVNTGKVLLWYICF